MANQFVMSSNRSLSGFNTKSTTYANTQKSTHDFIVEPKLIYDESYDVSYDDLPTNLGNNLNKIKVSISEFGGVVSRNIDNLQQNKISLVAFGMDTVGSDKHVQEILKKQGKLVFQDWMNILASSLGRNQLGAEVAKTTAPVWVSEFPVMDMLVTGVSLSLAGESAFSTKMITDVYVKNGALRFGKNMGNKFFGELIDKSIVRRLTQEITIPNDLGSPKKCSDLAKMCGKDSVEKTITQQLVQSIGKFEFAKFGVTAVIEIGFQFAGDFASQLIANDFDITKVDMTTKYGTNIYKGAVTTVFSIAGDFIAMTPLGKPGKAALQAIGATLSDKTLAFFTVEGDAAKTEEMRACAGCAILAGGAVGLIAGILIVSAMTPPIGWAFAIVAGAIIVTAAIGAAIVWVVYNFEKIVDGIVDKVGEVVAAGAKVVSAIKTTVIDFVVDVGAVVSDTIETVISVVQDIGEKAVDLVTDFGENVVSTAKTFIKEGEKVVDFILSSGAEAVQGFITILGW